MSRTYRKVRPALYWTHKGYTWKGEREVLGRTMRDGHWSVQKPCKCEWCRCERKHRILRQLDQHEMSTAINCEKEEE